MIIKAIITFKRNSGRTEASVQATGDVQSKVIKKGHFTQHEEANNQEAGSTEVLLV